MVNRNLTITAGNTTIVKKISVGRPVRAVVPATSNINTLVGVDTTSKVNGSVLVYNTTTGNFEATLDLEKQNVNGGSF